MLLNTLDYIKIKFNLIKRLDHFTLYNQFYRITSEKKYCTDNNFQSKYCYLVIFKFNPMFIKISYYNLHGKVSQR